MRLRLVAAVGLAAWAAPARPADPVDYTRDVKPFLQARCYSCHGVLQQKGKLRLDSGAFMLKGGRAGPAVEPGKPADSELLARVTDPDPEIRMPPEGKPLTPEQVATLKAWIEQGAKVPLGDKPETDPKDHWAFRKPVRPPVPAAVHPVDALLAAGRQKRGLTAAPPADKATLLRRVHLDLTGLPPTRDELHAFLADSSLDAYEKVVDRLLASPAYGERWARHWMDVWRYSDWYGRRSVPDVMNSYAMIWRWRDWIVRSLNDDRGYDRMVAEMLAADELYPEDPQALAATGFVVRNWFKWNYNNWMRDSVEHTAKAFLGLTMNCCHCHDHKYDPITQEEYFKFRAFFEPLELRHDRVPGEPDPGPFKKYVYGASYGPMTSGMIRVFDEKLDAKTQFYVGGDERNKVEGRAPVPAGVPAALGGRFEVRPVELPPAAWYPGLKPFIRQEETAKRKAAVTAADTAARGARAAGKFPAPPAGFGAVAGGVVSAHEEWADARRVAEARLTAARSDLAQLRAVVAADDVAHLGKPGDPKATARAAARAERQAKFDAAVLARVQAEVAVSGGKRAGLPADKLKPLEAAATAAGAKAVAAEKALDGPAAEYTPLTPQYPKTSTGRRAALARWVTSPDNPLTARVAVNHLWNWHFGRPLVETTNNFGRGGKPPTHPELLDWLARELTDNGWRMKPLHRLIVTSAAYRMQSKPFPGDGANKAADPDDVYLWRFPTLRVEAEVVRDAVLHAAGDLDRTVGGPEIPHEQGLTARRRSLYFAYHGESRMQFLDLFDSANPCDAYRRTSSVLPQQALAMSNSDLALRSARVLARKLAAAHPDGAGFVRAAFEQVLARPATAAEVTASESFLARQGKTFAADLAGVKATAAGADGPSADPVMRARENLVHALFNHTDFVTVR